MNENEKKVFILIPGIKINVLIQENEGKKKKKKKEVYKNYNNSDLKKNTKLRFGSQQRGKNLQMSLVYMKNIKHFLIKLNKK